MEHVEDLEDIKAVMNVLLNEVRQGKMRKTEVQRLAIGLNGGCHGVFKDNQYFVDLETVLGKVLDCWYKDNPRDSRTKDEKIQLFTKILIGLGRPDLSQRIKEEVSILASKDKKDESEDIKPPTGKNEINSDMNEKQRKHMKTLSIQHDWIIRKEPEDTSPKHGNLCTSYALAKVVIDTLDKGLWTDDQELEVMEPIEHIVKERMLHINKGGSCLPSAFNGQTICVSATKIGESDGKKFLCEVKLATQTCVPVHDQAGNVMPFKVNGKELHLPSVLVKNGQSLCCKSYRPSKREFECFNGTDDVGSKIKDDDEQLEFLEIVDAKVVIHDVNEEFFARK